MELGGECAGNPMAARIELAAGLEGGGSVVFLEYVTPVGRPLSQRVAERWQARAGDAEFGEVRRAAGADRRGVPGIDAVVGPVRPG